MLEEVVRILGHTASYRSHRVEGTGTEFSQSLLVDKWSEVVVLQHFNLLDFMRCTETIEEVDERNARLDSSQVSNASQIHNFLYRTFAQHRETCLAARHYILMIAEDTQGVRSQRTSRYMEYTR